MVAACASVQPGDLVEDTQKQLNHNRKWVTQILKAAMSINNITLAEMEVPESYLEALPKNGRACLGDVIYQYITSDHVLLFSVCVCSTDWCRYLSPLVALELQWEQFLKVNYERIRGNLLMLRYNVHGKIHHYPTLVWRLAEGLRGFVAMEDLSEIYEK